MAPSVGVDDDVAQLIATREGFSTVRSARASALLPEAGATTIARVCQATKIDIAA